MLVTLIALSSAGQSSVQLNLRSATDSELHHGDQGDVLTACHALLVGAFQWWQSRNALMAPVVEVGSDIPLTVQGDVEVRTDRRLLGLLMLCWTTAGTSTI